VIKTFIATCIYQRLQFGPTQEPYISIDARYLHHSIEDVLEMVQKELKKGSFCSATEDGFVIVPRERILQINIREDEEIDQ
jgi:hypothetical protein